jgi:cation:H+ antiporter
MPEFAIETRYAWLSVAEEGAQQVPAMLAVAGGTSRFLIGVGWPLAILIFCFRSRANGLRPGPIHLAGLILLFMIALYSFLIFMRGYLWVMDTPILLLMPVVFFWKLSRSSDSQEKRYASIETKAQTFGLGIAAISALLAYAAIATFLASSFFAEELISPAYTMDDSSLLRWGVILVSKLPLLVVIASQVWRRDESSGVSMLFTSQITVWSVLVAILPVLMFSGSIVSGNMDLVWLQDGQRLDVLLTASQAVFAVALMSGESVSRRGALVLFALFAGELTLGSLQPGGDASLVRGLFALIYLAGAVVIFLMDRSRLRALGRTIVASRRNAATPNAVAIPVEQKAELRAVRVERGYLDR